MKVKIKTKILSAMLITSFVIIIILSSIHYLIENQLATDYTEHIAEAIKQISKKNDEISSRVLTPFTEKYLQAVVDDISDEILFLKHLNNNKITNDILLNDKNLQKTLKYYTNVNKIDFINIVVIDNYKIVLSSSPDDLNEDYHPWIEKCSTLKTHIKNNTNYKGYYDFQINGEPTPIYLNVLHVKKTNYDVVAFLNLKEYLSPSNQIKKEKLNNELYRLKITSAKFLKKNLLYIGLVSLIVIVLIIIICIPISFYFATTVSKPIRLLQHKVKLIGKGNFDVQMEEQGSLEVADLIHTFNFLGQELKEYINNLAKEIKEKQFHESQIKIAANIQHSMLPEVTDEFKRSEFSIAAQLKPAIFAAGDFYDFFYINKDTIVITIADVSGKGISAAFFMALAKTILRNICEKENSPAKALSKANDILSTNNKEYMFVTVFLMYYDIRTGEFTYSNAGHHETILISNNNNYKTFGQLGNAAMGMIKDCKYSEATCHISKGDTLILYTDGITEAFSKDKELFGEANLKKLVIDNISLNVEKLSSLMIERVCEFEGHDPFDDKTIVIIRRND